MSLQEQQQQQPQQQQQQQPSFINYPNTATSSSNPSLSSSHSSGSFGAVFVVLAVIVVVSAIACFLSRLCGKRHRHRTTKKSHHAPPLPRPEKREPKQGHHGNFDTTGFGDIEFGFGKGFPNGKQFGNGEMGKGAKGKPHVTFEFKGDPRGVGGRELKGGEFNAI